MKIYHHLNEFIKPQYPIVTQGTFDGVHVGHQKLLGRIRDLAAEKNGEVVMLTFHPHPRKVIFGNEAGLEMLTCLKEKIDLMAKHGVQHLVIHPFTTEFSKMEYDDFVKEVLVEKLGVKTLVIGYDHQFGHQRKGSMKTLREMAPSLGFEVEEIPEQEIDAIGVSSTRIRKALHAGEVEVAAQLLGYRYHVSGRVVQGNRVGRTIGYPTANIQPEDPDKLIPANGIYAVKVCVEGKWWNGALSIGHRPTFDNGARTIEVHILGFDDDIYGKEITLEFYSYLRPELRFATVNELVQQMNKDVEQSLLILNR
ncbi:MAG: bifunctional riboflavin kinase/FAD synthetase [Bacteroidia bacterium]